MNTSDPVYAGFLRRVAASLIDTLLSAVILIPVVKLYQQNISRSPSHQALLDKANAGIQLTQTELATLLNTQFAENLPSMAIQNISLAIVVVLFWIYRSATPGKMMLSMHIVDEATLQAPSKKQCIIRYLGYFPAFLCLGLGFVWVYFDKKHQGWHDKMARTVVIIKK